MHINNQNIEQAKRKSITDYLASNGIYPVRKSNIEYWYKSPFRIEKESSFKVDVNTNRWIDFADAIKQRDIIDLVMKLEGKTFHEAVVSLSNCNIHETRNNTFSFQGNKTNSSIEIIEIRNVYLYHLKYYIRKRGIPERISKLYLKECKYKKKEWEKFFSGLCFANQKGGYEIISVNSKSKKVYKLSTSPKYFTLIEGNKEKVDLFEGIFDFLSSLVFGKKTKPINTTIVLNSLSFIDSAIEFIEPFKSINLFLDNDEAGGKATEKIKGIYPHAKDWSKKIYPKEKDLNDYLKTKING